ncbi:MAG: hypothetical protein KBS59_00585 [Clostridiales bacterium]|nr:hypothetical protein [Clostridiales bacterium]
MFTNCFLSSLTSTQLNEIVAPLMEVVQNITPVLLGVVAGLGSIWCILLGVKYAKADDPQEHEKAKNGLKNAIIGFVLIFVLLIALNTASDLFEEWWSHYEYKTFG